MDVEQYTLDELLELSRQFDAYGTLLFCPSDHEHREGEMQFEVIPPEAATTREMRELRGSCEVCGREIHAFNDPMLSRRSPLHRRPAPIGIKQSSLIFGLSVKSLALQREYQRAEGNVQRLQELRAVTAELRWRARQSLRSRP